MSKRVVSSKNSNLNYFCNAYLIFLFINNFIFAMKLAELCCDYTIGTNAPYSRECLSNPANLNLYFVSFSLDLPSYSTR